jgi:DNA-binding response OmpR family regulator
VKTSAARLLVVHDDPVLRECLNVQLDLAGYRVSSRADLPAWLGEVAGRAVDLVILGRFNPTGDSVGLTRQVRSDRDLPVIRICPAGESRDCVRALELGTDDCLTGLFDPNELVARVGAVLRRYEASLRRRKAGGRIRFGPYELDLRSLELTRDGEPVGLTAGEADLLRVFVAHPKEGVLRRVSVSRGESPILVIPGGTPSRP